MAANRHVDKQQQKPSYSPATMANDGHTHRQQIKKSVTAIDFPVTGPSNSGAAVSGCPCLYPGPHPLVDHDFPMTVA